MDNISTTGGIQFEYTSTNEGDNNVYEVAMPAYNVSVATTPDFVKPKEVEPTKPASLEEQLTSLAAQIKSLPEGEEKTKLTLIVSKTLIDIKGGNMDPEMVADFAATKMEAADAIPEVIPELIKEEIVAPVVKPKTYILDMGTTPKATLQFPKVTTIRDIDPIDISEIAFMPELVSIGDTFRLTVTGFENVNLGDLTVKIHMKDDGSKQITHAIGTLRDIYNVQTIIIPFVEKGHTSPSEEAMLATVKTIANNFPGYDPQVKIPHASLTTQAFSPELSTMNNIKTKTLNIMPVYIIDQDGTKRVYVNSGLTTGEDIHVYKDIVFQIKKSLGEDSHVTLLDTDKRPIELTKMLEG